MNEFLRYKEKIIIIILVITIFPILLIFLINIYSNEVYASPDNNTVSINPNLRLPPILDREDFAYLFAPTVKMINAFGGTKGDVPNGGKLFKHPSEGRNGDITITIKVANIARETGAFCYLDGKRWLAGFGGTSLCTADGELYRLGAPATRWYTVDTSYSLTPTHVRDLGWHEFKVELFNIFDSKITSTAIWKWETVKAFYLY